MNTPQKILLIDDDSLTGQLVGMLVAAFRGESYTLDHVMEAGVGLERLMSGAYALCLLDYQLGSGNGLEILRAAKAQQCPTPVIMLTGDSREETDLAAMEGGAADFINKRDLKPDALERAVDYAIKTAKVWNQLQAAKKAAAGGK